MLVEYGVGAGAAGGQSGGGGGGYGTGFDLAALDPTMVAGLAGLALFAIFWMLKR